MKKQLFFLFLFAAFFGSAQSYQPLLADSITQFQVVPLQLAVRMANPGLSSNCVYDSPGTFVAQGDSVYNGKIYKKFGTWLGMMREDTVTRKVYFIQYCNTTEELLYDFSMQLGDSINYTFAYSSSYMMSGWYKVDSIVLKHDYRNYYRKHFFLSNRLNGTPISGGPRATLEMIEGVGNTYHPLFLYGDFYMGTLMLMGNNSANCVNTPYDMLLSCKWNNNVKVYFDSCAYATSFGNPCVSHTDSCNYGNTCGGIEELGGIKNVSLFPNPANDKLTVEVESDRAITLSLSVFNTLGLECGKEAPVAFSKGNDKITLNIAGLAPGVYMLRISNGDRFISKPLVIAR